MNTPSERAPGCGIRGRMLASLSMLWAGGKVLFPLILVAGALSGFRGLSYSRDHLQAEAPPIMITLFMGWLSGGLLTPLLFPRLPGESLSLKGAMAGGLGLLAWPAACSWLHLTPWSVATAILVIPALSSWISLVLGKALIPGPAAESRREQRLAVVLQACMAGTGVILWIIPRFV